MKDTSMDRRLFVRNAALTAIALAVGPLLFTSRKTWAAAADAVATASNPIVIAAGSTISYGTVTLSGGSINTTGGVNVNIGKLVKA